MKRILLLGEKSFAANGLYDLLKQNQLKINCFSRGHESINGDFIKGDVFNLSNNIYLSDQYDIVINFILIKNGSIDSNISYIREVDKLCRLKKVNTLLHISSISAYPGNASFIDENSEIDTDWEYKGKYAALKVAVDNYLKSLERPYNLSFIRPGYIYSHGISPDISGIGFRIFPNAAIIMGNNKTPLTTVSRNKLHEGILKVILTGCDQPSYLMFENNNSTKRDFLLSNGYKLVIPLNRFVVTSAAKLLKQAGIFNTSHLEQVKSLFRNTHYSCYQTEFYLQHSFIANSFCIIGAGTYGSYVANLIKETYKDAFITLFDVGNENIKDEEEIGYKTQILKDPYIGTSKGRFFGFGGTSAKWGGQLLTFSENDFNNPSGLLKDIIRLNRKYRDRVFGKFNIHNKFEEKQIGNGLFIKTGFWLGYFRRNLFKYFRVSKIDNLKIIANTRVISLINSGNNIRGLDYLRNGHKYSARFDRYFLCSGAFESFRILLNSNLISKESVSFSDHLSQKMFLIKGSTKIGEDDFAFRVNGTSLITKRLIGEIDGVSFYVNPKFNDNFPFFQNLKALLFKKEWNLTLIKSMILDFPSFLAFCWSIIIKKRIYAYKNEWEIDIDIENPSFHSEISLSDSKDKFGVNALDLKFITDKGVTDLYKEIHLIVKEYLDKNNVNYVETADEIHVTKCEDTYHPYGMLDNLNSINEYYDWFNNMLVINTGILPRAGGINTAGSVFPIIEEYFDRINKQNEN